MKFLEKIYLEPTVRSVIPGRENLPITQTFITLQNRKIKFIYFLLGSLSLLPGCITVPTPEMRQQNATHLAQQSGWHGITLPTSPHVLHAFVPENIHSTNTLSIYIEGDGLAWRSRRRISRNPTPINPLALQLALQDQHAAAYLARPCQYVTNQAGCNHSLWTSARFSADVIASTNQAINLLKRRFMAKHIRLIGYSGGGGVAALVAARRDDISQLITVAGNLDHVVWTSHHNISPLTQSLNPADAWQTLQEIPQVHFVGKDDRIIGTFVAKSYRKHFPAEHQPTIKVIEDVDHYCCWPDKWPELLRSVKSDD
jgi:pimeloyl-ACP methyl ester carboxylesterase